MTISCRLVTLASLAACLTACFGVRPCAAQSNGQGFVAVGLGGYEAPRSSSGAGQLAGGGEGRVQPWLGVGAEANITGVGEGAWLGLSLGPTFRSTRSTGTVPFATVRYALLATGSNALNATEVGAGIDVWTSRRRGFRLEARDTIVPWRAGTDNAFIVRVGLLFR